MHSQAQLQALQVEKEHGRWAEEKRKTRFTDTETAKMTSQVENMRA